MLERYGKRVFHLHFYQAGAAQIETQLVFRDYLRTHRDEALAYETVKRAAAEAHPRNSLAYNGHKAGWTGACLERGRAWVALNTET